MLRSQRVIGRVEIGKVAGADVDRADAGAYFARVQQVEVDEPLQRLMQRSGIVEARRGVARERRPERRRKSWLEEAGLALHEGSCRRKGVVERSHVERKRKGVAQSLTGGPFHRGGTDGFPEFAQ